MQYLLYLSQIKVLLKAVKCIIQYILLTALEILNLLIVECELGPFFLSPVVALISKGLFSLKELGQKLPTNFVTF
jgi:hypothetical protein